MNKLSNREFKIIQNKEFLLTKATAISKIESILSEARENLKKSLSENSLALPDKSLFKTSKISRGEHYRGLPYLVLDYPAIFSKENIFAFRSMFWWGNFFSSTLHLQGDYLNHYRNKIINNIQSFKHQNIYIATGESPWEYHYGKDNYELLNKEHGVFIENCQFLKLSKKFEINEWEFFPELAVAFFNQIISVIAPQSTLR